VPDTDDIGGARVRVDTELKHRRGRRLDCDLQRADAPNRQVSQWPFTVIPDEGVDGNRHCGVDL